jgi:porin
VRNFSGGIQNGTSILGLFDFGINYSFFQKAALKNTSLYAHLLKTAGIGSSERFIGDVQVASNIEGRASRFIYELLLRQKIGNVTISAGLHDLNNEFMSSSFAGDFINSSFGVFPAISLNIPVSIYPVTTFGGIISYNKKRIHVVAGIYNLNHNYTEEKTFHVGNHFYQHGFIGVGEIHYRQFKSNEIHGEYKIGMYVKDCNHNDGTKIPGECVREKNYGLYFIGDHVLYQFSSGGIIGAFIQAGITPATINYASEYYGAGILQRGIFKKKLPEQFGIAFGRVKLNYLEDHLFTDIKRYETVLEFTGKIPVSNKFLIQPDIQYIITPSGIYNDAFTGIIRFILIIS